MSMEFDETDYSRGQGGAAIGARLRRLSERIDREAGAVYAQLGVPFEQRWMGVLNQLVLRGPQSVGELAQVLGISHPSVSQTRRSLQAAGLVAERPDPRDARRRTLHLTPEGVALVTRLKPIWAALIEAAVELNDEAEDVVAALDRLEDALGRRSLLARAMERLGA
jgi:DNA-binding MarR family transcriptional regulator